MPPNTPVRFIRNIAGAISNAWNRVQLEDENGLVYNAANPLPTGGVVQEQPTSYNVTLTLANTEYNQAMPANCRGFEFQCRSEADVRFAFVTGRVAGPVAPYNTLKAGDYYFSGLLDQGVTPSTLFFASPTAGTIVELIVWL